MEHENQLKKRFQEFILTSYNMQRSGIFNVSLGIIKKSGVSVGDKKIRVQLGLGGGMRSTESHPSYLEWKSRKKKPFDANF